MLSTYYSIHTREELENYLHVYIPLMISVAQRFDIDLTDDRFTGDHLGMQVLSAEEFDESSKLLASYGSLIHDSVIHDRRNRVYEFITPIQVAGITIKSIEIFEPKPGADPDTLKPGIEHVAFYAEDYDELFETFKKDGHPIDKHADFDGSKFFKTSLVDMVEIEFRNDYLGIF